MISYMQCKYPYHLIISCISGKKEKSSVSSTNDTVVAMFEWLQPRPHFPNVISRRSWINQAIGLELKLTSCDVSSLLKMQTQIVSSFCSSGFNVLILMSYVLIINVLKLSELFNTIEMDLYHNIYTVGTPIVYISYIKRITPFVII